MAESIVDTTDITERIIRGLKLEYRPPTTPAAPGSDMGGLGGGAPGGGGSLGLPGGGGGDIGSFGMPAPDMDGSIDDLANPDVGMAGTPTPGPAPANPGQSSPTPTASRRPQPRPRTDNNISEMPYAPGRLVSVKGVEALREAAKRSNKPLTPARVQRIIQAAERTKKQGRPIHAQQAPEGELQRSSRQKSKAPAFATEEG
jgi:hypothetical protein